MRVMLVYPPISKQERYSSAIGNAGGNQLPLGIVYLAAHLRQAGHEVSVIDGEARGMTVHEIVEQMKLFGPALFGISSTTVAFHRSIELAQEVRAAEPRLPIVLGGPHVSSNPEHGMSFELFDYGVLGEGEHTLLDLVRALEERKDLGGIDGLAHRVQGQLVINKLREPIADLDEIPHPAYDLIPDLSVYAPPPCNYKKFPVATIITGRGCPNRCTFCDQSVFGSSLRQRSAANIVAEIEHLRDVYGIREIQFVDDTFTVRPARIRELFDLLDSKNIRFPWTCASRINTVDFELLKYMRDHGCWHISFGIESGNEEILLRIKKRISLSRAREVIGWCAQLGIRTKGFFIIGHPGETEETIDQTIRLALDFRLDDVVATINTPIPGSQQYREAREYGTLDDTDWSKFNYWRPVFVPKGLTPEILLARHKEFYRRFYFRPRILMRYAASFFAPSGMRRLWSLCRSLPFVLGR